jgi:ATP-dependent Lon protease
MEVRKLKNRIRGKIIWFVGKNGVGKKSVGS